MTEAILLILAVTAIALLLYIFNYIKSVINQEQEKKGDLYTTSKVVKRILLNNRWGCIDDKIGILIDNTVSLNFKLGIDDENKNV